MTYAAAAVLLPVMILSSSRVPKVVVDDEDVVGNVGLAELEHELVVRPCWPRPKGKG